jgi:hypothetical protein
MGAVTFCLLSSFHTKNKFGNGVDENEALHLMLEFDNASLQDEGNRDGALTHAFHDVLS